MSPSRRDLSANFSAISTPLPPFHSKRRSPKSHHSQQSCPRIKLALSLPLALLVSSLLALLRVQCPLSILCCCCILRCYQSLDRVKSKKNHRITSRPVIALTSTSGQRSDPPSRDSLLSPSPLFSSGRVSYPAPGATPLSLPLLPSEASVPRVTSRVILFQSTKTFVT
jgi:hypothetical protein